MNVLSLCDLTGNMVRPWMDAGHTATIVDIQHESGAHTEGNLTRVGGDIREFRSTRCQFDFVFAFPPCDHFAVSGARWWASKGQAKLNDALELVAACRRIIAENGSQAWMVENPVGRLSRYWREPDYSFNPCEYGGYLTPAGDHYTKKTCLWTGSEFVMPEPRPVPPLEGSKMHRIPPGPNRKNLRSATPKGFAVAVFMANESGPRQLSIRGIA